KKLKATPESLKEQIPILFGNVTMKGGQLNYRLNEDKSLSVDSLNFDDHRAVAHGLKLRSNDPLPPYLTDTLDRSIWVDISLKRLEINRYNFELSEAKKQLKSTSITLDGLCSTLYKNKRLPEDTLNASSRDSSFLRRLPLKFNADTIRLSHAEVDYHELFKTDRAKPFEDRLVLQLENYDMAVYGVSFDAKAKEDRELPFASTDFSVSGDRARYRLNSTEIFQIDSLAIKKHWAAAFQPRILPIVDQEKFSRRKSPKPDWVKA